MFLGWPFSKIVRKFWSVQKHGSGEWGLLAVYRNEEILFKIFREILIYQETWLWWMGTTCTIQKWRNSWKFFFSEKLFANFDPSRNMALVNGGYSQYTEMKKFFQKFFVKFWYIKKHGSGEWGLLALYRNEEILENSSSLKRQVRF